MLERHLCYKRGKWVQGH